MANVLNYISYLLIRLFMATFAALPMSFGFAFAKALGVAGYYLLPGRRKIALENLELALGAERTEEERERIARESFINAAYSAMEMIHFERIIAEWKERFSFEGDELIDEMIRKKKGFFVFGGHLGAWMMLPIFPKRFIPGNVVIRPQRNPYFDRYLRRLVEKWGGRMINTRGTGDLIEDLAKKGEMVGFYMDQESRREQGVFVDFFGRPASSHVVPPYLAWKHDIPMFPYWMPRETPGRVNVIFKPPVEFVKTGDKDNDIRVNTQRLAREVEDTIRRYPEQWFWVHRRWKRQMDGSDREERKKLKKRGKSKRGRGAYVTSKDVSARESKQSGDKQ